MKILSRLTARLIAMMNIELRDSERGGGKMSLLEEAVAAITGAERKIDIASRNIANAQTAGYKREISYNEIAGISDKSRAFSPNNSSKMVVSSVAFSEQGVLTETGNPLDLAIRGEAYLLVRSGDTFFLSRGGQFKRGRDGTLIDAENRIVQQAGGGDLLLDTETPEILADGTVLSDGVPIGAVGLFIADDAVRTKALRSGMDMAAANNLSQTDGSELLQGMTERSNVILSDEMIGLARTQRMAEAGAQLVRAYDQLIGQAVATFGRKNG